MHERFQEDFNYDDSIANYGYIKKIHIYKVVIQGGALHNLVVSVKTRLCRVRWAGRDLTQRCRAEGDDRVQPHATDSTLGTAAQAVLLLTCPARGLAARNRSCFIPVATNPWPVFAAVRDQPPQSCHRISCACTTRPCSRENQPTGPPRSVSRKATRDAKPRKAMQYIREGRRKVLALESKCEHD